jgi:hypothetical protein
MAGLLGKKKRLLALVKIYSHLMVHFLWETLPLVRARHIRDRESTVKRPPDALTPSTVDRATPSRASLWRPKLRLTVFGLPKGGPQAAPHAH